MPKVRKIDDDGFEPTIGENAEHNYTWDGSSRLIRIEKTVGQFTYRKDLTWTGDDLTFVSEWVKL
jgi:hypothetical protein